MGDAAREVEELRAEVAYWASQAAHGEDVAAQLQTELKELREECDHRRAAREEERRQLLRKFDMERSRRCEQSATLALLLIACVLLIAVVASTHLQTQHQPRETCSECPPCSAATLMSSALAANGRRPLASGEFSDVQHSRSPSLTNALDYLGTEIEGSSPHGDRFARLQRQSARQVPADDTQRKLPANGDDLQIYAEKLLRVGDSHQSDSMLPDEYISQNVDAIDHGRPASLVPATKFSAHDINHLQTEHAEAANILTDDDTEQDAERSASVARACASMPCMNDGACVGPRAQATERGALDGWTFVEGQAACPAGSRPPLPSDIFDVAAAVELLCEWCIAALGGGNRLSGSGYGGKIEVETGDPPGDILCMPILAPKLATGADDQAPAYSCECARGWAGYNCDEDVDECAVFTPCHAGASCFDSTTTRLATSETSPITTQVAVGEYYCDCPLGRRGRNCDEIAPECSDASRHNYQHEHSKLIPTRQSTADHARNEGGTACANGGVCYTADDAKWSSAVAAALHESGIDSQPDRQSLSHSTSSTRNVLCDCAAGWVGPRCEQDFDECASNPCVGGGTCIQGHGASPASTTSAANDHSRSNSFSHGKFRCLCPHGRGGSRCEIASATEYATSSAIWLAEAAPSACTQLKNKAESHSYGAAGFFEGWTRPSHRKGWVALPPLGFANGGDQLSHSQDMLGLATLAFWMRPFSLAQQPPDLGPGPGLSGLSTRQVIISGGGGSSHRDSGPGEPQLYLEDGGLVFAVLSGTVESASAEGQPTEESQQHTGYALREKAQQFQISHRFAWTVPPNEWSHVTVTYGAAASLSKARPYTTGTTTTGKGFLDLYVNFHFVESAALPGSPKLDLRRLRIGGGVDGSDGTGISRTLHGMLAGIQIFDRPIRAHREVCDATTPGLLGWWAFAGIVFSPLCSIALHIIRKLTNVANCDMASADDGRTLIDLSENGWHALLTSSASVPTQHDGNAQREDEEDRTDGTDRPAIQPGLGWAKRINHG